MRFRKVTVDNALRDHTLTKAPYVIEIDHVVVAMLVTHVDNLCWATDSRYEYNMNNNLKSFTVKDDKPKSGKFRYWKRGLSN